MDAKALAKSKRAHSQHHSKKHHPNQTLKAPSPGTVGAASAKKPLGKQVREKSQKSHGSSALPSNWDRYEEEYDEGSEDPSQGSSSQATDFIVPKSKGADYAHLLSEASLQSQTNYSSESSPSFDDVLNDFNQGVGSLLSVKGQSILSWIADDNFIVEDKATTSHEASFLSLNLHALADQLSKADLSQRLFIESDLLPPELCTEDLQASSQQESDQGEATCGIEVAKKDSDALASHGVTEGDKNGDQYCEVMSSDTSSSSSRPVPTSASEGSKFTNQASKGSKFTNQAKDELWKSGLTGQSTSLKFAAELNVNSVTNPEKNSSGIFKAAAAEAELDMLLNSFSETKFIDSSGFTEKSNYTSYVPQGETSTSLMEGISSVQLVPAQPMKAGPDLSKSALIATNLDDTIDDLLKGTSNLINQSGTSWSNEVKAAPIDIISPPSSHSVSKSKLLDDFDSWLDTL